MALIEKELICLDKEYKDKYQVIKELSLLASNCDKVSDIIEYEQTLLQREEEFSTAIGCLSAVPHGECDSVKEPFIIFSRAIQSFKWDDIDVQMIFMIGLPLKDSAEIHMRILNSIAVNLINEDFRNALLTSNNEKEIFDILQMIGV